MAEYITPTIANSVGTQIASAWNLVTQAYNQGIGALASLSGASYDIPWQPLTIAQSTAPTINLTSPSAPQLPSNFVVNPQFEGSEISIENLDVDSPDIPTFQDRDYGFSIPDAPDPEWPEFTKDAPVASDITLESAPDASIPAVPSLDDFVIPAPPEYSIPDFDGEIPALDITAPTLGFDWGESQYNSDLKTRLGDWLYDQIALGGTGLDEATEQAIYDRATSRNEEEEQALLDAINDGMSGQGFPLPTGAYGTRVLSAENKILRNRTDLNNDILIQQSKLAQENTHFVIQEARGLETVLIDYHKSAQDRALDAAKFTITAASQVYQLKVEEYKARLASYSTLADVYRTKIQGEIAKAEFYKAQIDGVRASVEVQRNVIDAYRAQVSSILATVEVYKAQMEGANIRATIDKTRMEGFVAEVQAYATRVNAELAKYEGYKARIAGEATKVEMRKAHAETYLAEVSGVKTKSDVEIAALSAKVEQLKARVDVFNGYVNKYNADVQAGIASVEASAKAAGLKTSVYEAGSRVRAAEISAKAQIYAAQASEASDLASLSLKDAELAIQTLMGQFQLSAENMRSVAQVSGQMAAAAASSVNASLSASHNDSNSASNQGVYSRTINESTTNSYSNIEQTIHQYSN